MVRVRDHPFLSPAMSTQLRISAQPRTALGRNAVNRLKTAGLVPGVIYGAKDAPQSLQFSAREVGNLLDHATSESVLVEVAIEGAGTKTALLQEVQHHPVSGRVLHLDLHAVAMDEVLSAEVPIEAAGEPEGVKTGGGVLQQSLRTLEIECLPTDLPDLIRVDVTKLNVGDSLHVRDLVLPRGVTALNDADLTVVAVTEPTVVEEPAAGDTPLTQPEVITEKKADPAAGGAAAAS